MELLKHCRIKANSLTESIIAMVLIAICLSITIVIYVRVLNTERNIPSYIAEQKVKELLWETTKTKRYINEDYSFSSFEISKEVTEMSADKGIYRIEFKVTSGGKINRYKYIVEN